MQAVFINIPCPTKAEAIKLCEGLLEQDLCATAKIHEHVHLMWVGKDSKVTGDDIVLMTLKSTDVNIPKIHRYIHDHHSWGNPCVEVLPVFADLC
jgi:uncharacterized protein involved in tolerance to divalent cations